MIYVDDDLCTGCGICVEACRPGALSVAGCTASIDETLCTSCGRCIDLCATGAIISVETVLECPPSRVPAQTPETQSLWARTTPLSSAGLDAAVPAAASPAPASSAQSKLDLIEKALSGLLSVASFFLDRRQARSAGLPASSAVRSAKAGRRSSAAATGSAGCAGPRQGRGGRQGLDAGQGLGRGQGPRDGRGRGGSGGQNDRCQAKKRNRST